MSRTWFVTWEQREVRGAHVDADTWEDALAAVKAAVKAGDEDVEYVEYIGDSAYAVADDTGAVVHGPEPEES